MTDFDIRIYRTLSSLWRRRYTIIMPIVWLPIIGLLIGISSPKQYKAHTSMLIQETAKLNPFLEDLSVSAMLNERIDALKTLLHSRHILNKVAIELGTVDEKTSDVKRDEIIAHYSQSLAIQIVGKDLIRIDHTADRPEGMKKFLEVVSHQFIEQLLAPERSSISDSSHFLQDHLDQRRSELTKAETALAQFKAEHAETLPELHSLNITRLNQLKQKLAEREAEMAGAVKDVGGLNQLLSHTNPVVGKIEEQIVKARSELALMRSRYTDKHSKIQALKRTLRRLESERESTMASASQIVDADQLWSMASAMTPTSSSSDMQESPPILISQLENLQNAKRKADVLSEEVRLLRKMIRDTEFRIREFGDKESTLVRLTRDLNVKQELYDAFLKRYEMAKVTGSLGRFEQSKRIKIIDRPFIPSRSANLPLTLFIIAGLIGGVALGIGFAMVLEIMDTTVRDRQTLELITQAPVISRFSPALQPH